MHIHIFALLRTLHMRWMHPEARPRCRRWTLRRHTSFNTTYTRMALLCSRITICETSAFFFIISLIGRTNRPPAQHHPHQTAFSIFKREYGGPKLKKSIAKLQSFKANSKTTGNSFGACAMIALRSLGIMNSSKRRHVPTRGVRRFNILILCAVFKWSLMNMYGSCPRARASKGRDK